MPTFFPAATKTADRDGMASLSAGLGDVVVWATDGEYYGFGKETLRQDS